MESFVWGVKAICVPPDFSHDNIISKNSICSNLYLGIVLYSSIRNSIENNSIYKNSNGMKITNSSYNLVINNTLYKNQNSGIELFWPSFSNFIYHNSFIDNQNQVIDYSGYENFWDNGYPSGGNYFSDYNGEDSYSGPLQDIPGADGMGDTPYKNNGYGISLEANYPLLVPKIDQLPIAVPPTQPQNVSAQVGADYILLTWEKPIFNGSSNILGYRIYKKEIRDKDWNVIYVENSLHYNDTNVTGGVSLKYMITAINKAGVSINSTEIIATPTATPDSPIKIKDEDNNELFNVRYILLTIILLSIMVFLIISIRSKKKAMKAQKQKKVEKKTNKGTKKAEKFNKG